MALVGALLEEAVFLFQGIALRLEEIGQVCQGVVDEDIGRGGISEGDVCVGKGLLLVVQPSETGYICTGTI